MAGLAAARRDDRTPTGLATLHGGRSGKSAGRARDVSGLYRIHGSNEPWTIGSQVSSGCIRMRNEDVTDLYDRVKVGTKVVVM
jgi:lipoprotein-anchoring transpeptidase ErfK/SrfK